MLSLINSPIIYSQSDQGHPQGGIDETEHLSTESKLDTPTEVHQCKPADVTSCNIRKDDKLNWENEGVLGFDAFVKRTGRVTQKKNTDQTTEPSQMTSQIETEQQTGALVSADEHAAALKTIRQQNELIEKLSANLRIAQEYSVINQQSVEAVAESSPASPREDDDDGDVKGDDDASKEESIVDIIPAIYSNERMNENDALKIQTHMKSLWLNIEPKELIIELHSLFVFDNDEFDYLLDYVEKKGRSNGALKMLRKLYRKGPNSYCLFLVALERCNHTWVIKTLEPDCEIYEGKMKYSGQKYYELIDNTSPKYREFVTRCEKNIEDVYDDHPGQQFVVVKKLAKGCVEVTFHLISLGSSNDVDLRRPLLDLVKSGFIGTDPVKADEFYLRQITDEELASERESITQRRIIVLENEIETLKLQINELLIENEALKATSANSLEMEKYKEHLADKYTDTLQDNELIITSLQEQPDQQATASNVNIDRADGERLKQVNDLKLLPTYDNLDKDRVEKGEGSIIDETRVEWIKLSENWRRMEQILDYLVTWHSDQLISLIQLLEDNGVIDNDESKTIALYIDIGHIERAAWTLSDILTPTSGPNSYQYFIPCLIELDLSHVVNMFLIDQEGTTETMIDPENEIQALMLQINELQILPIDADQDKDRVEQEDGAAVDNKQTEHNKSVEDRVKIEQIIYYLVTRQPDKLKPLVQLLGDRGVIAAASSQWITMCIYRDNIKGSAWELSKILTSRICHNSYQQFMQCLRRLGLSYLID